jgi:hypothetical protein
MSDYLHAMLRKGVLVGTLGMAWWSSGASAVFAETVRLLAIEIHSSSNQEITLRALGASRREVVADLLRRQSAGMAVAEIERLDEALGDLTTDGEYRGSIPAVLAQLLDRFNYTVAYVGRDGTLYISRVVIGRSASASRSGENHVHELVSPVARRVGAGSASTASIEVRRRFAREKVLSRMRSIGELIAKRLSSLPPGRVPARTRAISTVPIYAAIRRHGNVPYIPQ